jgi:cardiolipin synthase
MQLRDLPNIISALRLIAVVPVVWLLLEHEFGWALALFAAAGVSDGVDGYLAKRFGWQSQLGGMLDPLADKILLVSCFLVLGSMGLIPVWLVLAAVFRDLVIVSGALAYHFRVAEVKAAPTLVSKLNTVLQLVLVVLVILDAGVFPLPRPLIVALVWACLATVVVSGVQYVWVWSRKARVQGWKDE